VARARHQGGVADACWVNDVTDGRVVTAPERG
jgi:hypothetical protein